MLDVSRLQAGYGRARVVHDFSLSVGPGEVLGLVGRNGVGKTTSLKAILGLVDVFGGTVSVRGHVAGPMSPVSACRLGIGYVSQQREVCPELTVEQNLMLPLVANRLSTAAVDGAYQRFPRLAERRRQVAGSLSGCERKLLAFARIMLLTPSIYLIDEPTEGLMPKAVDEIGHLIATIARDGAAVVVVEQNLALVRAVATRVALMNNGRIEATVDSLGAEEAERYLGV
jgi:branched-chain amino acid transport system ATP-binding protein